MSLEPARVKIEPGGPVENHIVIKEEAIDIGLTEINNGLTDSCIDNKEPHVASRDTLLAGLSVKHELVLDQEVKKETLEIEVPALIKHELNLELEPVQLLKYVPTCNSFSGTKLPQETDTRNVQRDYTSVTLKPDTSKKPYGCEMCTNQAIENKKLCKECERVQAMKQLDNLLTGKAGLKRNRKHVKTIKRPEQTCEICERKFKSLNALYSHEQAHIENRTYTCKMCNKHFSRLCALNTHKRIHSEETP